MPLVDSKYIGGAQILNRLGSASRFSTLLSEPVVPNHARSDALVSTSDALVSPSVLVPTSKALVVPGLNSGEPDS